MVLVNSYDRKVLFTRFQDDERLQAIYDIWQAINYAEVKCNIIEDSSTD